MVIDDTPSSGMSGGSAAGSGQGGGGEEPRVQVAHGGPAGRRRDGGRSANDLGAGLE
jgi:hypothetical protein